ncbi:DUF4190 domain-containing protein [Prauserella alba]|uniref:DUF4190 domain-containing protein n=1 Tax=Prauserella alba TaxID=176898 RepID=A0ABN1VPQ9_9PSEU|nr:DUF4190 domain-containing protein [Prauserella alba]MCP2180890.1 membrane protein [Prauserella alba]
MSATQSPQMPPAPTEEPAREARNGLGITGFVLGLVGLLFSWIPFIGVIAWPLVVLGLIFSILGLLRVKNLKATNKGMSIAGLVVSVLGLGVAIVMLIVTSQAVNEVTEEANREVTVQYEVTGDASGVEVVYSTFGGGNYSTNTASVDKLPWSEELTTKGLFKGGDLRVVVGAGGGSAACKVTVDGEVVKTAEAEGVGGVANCNGFAE